jgi:cell division protein FtsI (penicillin-binding protein 3)
MSKLLNDYTKSKRHYYVESCLSKNVKRHRLNIIISILSLWSLVIVARLWNLQFHGDESWSNRALKQHVSDIKLAPERGAIISEDGKYLAISVPSLSLFVRPKQLKDIDEAAHIISSDLALPINQVLAKLKEDKPFVWVERQLPRLQVERLLAKKIRGIDAAVESKRAYPFNEAASMLLGKVGVDGQGLLGVEAIFDGSLRGESKTTRVLKDALGKKIVEEVADFELPKGEELRLSLNSDLQLILDEELERGVLNAKAKAGMAILIDALTGEVLAISQEPKVNYNYRQVSGEETKNLLVETVAEPGSIFKPIVAAAALEEKVISANDMINCEAGRYPFSNHVIKDVHPSKIISFFDVVVRSSNIGMVKVGERLGEKRLYHYLTRFGFGEKTSLGLQGESAGILRNYRDWAKLDLATHSFGQGVAVTPLQMVRAVAAIANGGVLPELRLTPLSQEQTMIEEIGRQVISSHTARIVREMMYAAVEDKEGTGGRAKISTVRVAGKTGTAQKARSDGKGYQKGAYLSSFVGFVDGRKELGIPKILTLLVSIDQPSAGNIYGGQVAAPVFSGAISRSLRALLTKRVIKREVPKYLEANYGVIHKFHSNSY